MTVALVTGASRGIGRAIALRLSSAGLSVAVTARTIEPSDGAHEGSLSETMDLIHGIGGHAVAIGADLGDVGARAEIVRAAAETLGGPVQVLVNNAAAPRRFELGFTGMTREEFRAQVGGQRVGGLGPRPGRPSGHAPGRRRLDRERLLDGCCTEGGAARTRRSPKSAPSASTGVPRPCSIV